MEAERRNYLHLTETSQIGKFPTDGNFIAFSELKSIEAQMTRRDVIGIKYVLQGEENYVINGSRYRVKPGQILIVDDMEHGEVFTKKTPTTAKGLCINLDKQMVLEILAGTAVNIDNPNKSLEEDYNFLLNATPASQYILGNLTSQLANRIASQPDAFDSFDNDLFYSLAESLIRSHREAGELSRKVQASKKITQQEVYKRLLFAKEMMDSLPDQQLDVADLATHAGLSEYHFSRVFKSVFGSSPYRYLLSNRLKRASEYLKKGEYSVTETAYKCGFSDIHTFSKAFKKEFSATPSAFSRK